MYVISTLKRPVPLEHYLYTGLTGKSKDERFLIVNAEGAFVPKGYGYPSIDKVSFFFRFLFTLLLGVLQVHGRYGSQEV
jgi:hypothetical protein